MSHGKLNDLKTLLINKGYPIMSFWNPSGKGMNHWLSLYYPSGAGLMLDIYSVYLDENSQETDESLIIVNYYTSGATTVPTVEYAVRYIDAAYDNYRKGNIPQTKIDKIDDGVLWSGKAVAVENIDEKLYLVTGRHNGKTLFMQNLLKNVFGFKIKDVIFNDPATIVFWEDGEKTVVQCQNGEEFDPEKGLAMAISKRVYGNDYNYYEVFKKWIGKYNKKKFQKALAEAMKITPDEIIRDGHRYALIKDGTEVTDNGVISSLKLDETGTVIKPFCDIKIDKQEDNNK